MCSYIIRYTTVHAICSTSEKGQLLSPRGQRDEANIYGRILQRVNELQSWSIDQSSTFVVSVDGHFASGRQVRGHH